MVEAITGRVAADVIREWMAEPRDSWFLRDPAWMTTLYPPSGASAEEVRAFLDTNNYYIQEVRTVWMQELLTGGLRGRMTLFWHNHFVTDFRKYRYAPLAVRYVRLLQSAAFGFLPHFAKQMGREGAMLYYLDGRYSTRTAPNENYARELLELFTMGPSEDDGTPNYTQSDIREAARALTGHRMNVREQFGSYFQSSLHDRDQKTIFGQTGNFDDVDFVDLVFRERSDQVARFIARKLIRELVQVDPERTVVDALAERFKAADFNIGEALVALLGSSYFFDNRVMGVRVKEPVEMMALQASLGGVAPGFAVAQRALSTADELGQSLLAPPNVAGWPGDHAWLNTDLLPRRWAASEWMAGYALTAAQWRQLVSEWTSASSYPAVDFPIRLAETVLAPPLEHVSIPELDEPFAGDLSRSPLPDDFLNGPQQHINLVKLFLAGSPWYEWNPLSDVGITRIVSFLRELARLPEYQLS
jgi:uncharacterized protein (DUF1800 family)